MPSATPRPPSNRPGLPALGYRVGTYATFRRSMLERLPHVQVGEPPRTPLRGLTARSSDDFAIAYLELGATLADILTFYQERMANEAYLGTAVQDASVRRLATLLGYRPAPGRSAQAALAFTVQKGAQVRVPPGLRVQSVPGQDAKPQVFETSAELAADAAFNELSVCRTQPGRLFPGDLGATFAGAGLNLAVGDTLLFAPPPGTYAETPVAASSLDGRQELFAVGADHSLWHNRQVAPNGAWSGWQSLGGGLTGPPVAARDQQGRLQVFVRGTDNAVWQRRQEAPNSGNWSGWGSLGGVVGERLALGRNLDGRLEVFGRGTDGALWHKWQNSPGGTWSGWASLGGNITQPAVASNHDGRLEVFARGTDGALWHKWQNSPGGGWSGWASLQGGIQEPVVAMNQDGRLEAFVRGNDNALWHKWQVAPGGIWSGWASLGGVFSGAPAVARNHDGRLEAFVRGTDNAVWHTWQVVPNGAWSGWASLGGVTEEAPTAGRNHDGRLEVFARGTDGALWRIGQAAPNGGWGGWASLGSLLRVPPLTFARRRVTRVEADRGAGTTSVGWDKPLGMLPAATRVHVLRLQASPFGHNAPDWRGLPRELRDVAVEPEAPFPNSWNEAAAVPAVASGPFADTSLDLDAAYKPVRAGTYAVLSRPDVADVLACIEAVGEASRSDYMLSAKVSRLLLVLRAPFTAFPMRRTLVMAQAEELPIADVPAADPPAGSATFQLEGDLSGLQRGRRLLVVGVPVGGTQVHSEWARVEAATLEAGPGGTWRTRLQLQEGLERGYALASLRIHGNATDATHGQSTVEVVGSGAAQQPFQSFALRKGPLAHLPDAGAEQGVSAALRLEVGGQAWSAVPSLHGAGPRDLVYALAIDGAGSATVHFGDGVMGARPATGTGNLVARYRVGWGAAGAIPPGRLSNLLDKPLGLKGASNPVASEGGVEPEPAGRTRLAAPGTVRTLGRIVSLRDFEDAALAFVGVAKARAAWQWMGDEQGVVLTVAGDGGAAILPGGDLHGALVAHLDRLRDPYRPLRVQAHAEVPLRIAVRVEPAAGRAFGDVEPAVRAAARVAYAFDTRGLGQPVHLSALYGELASPLLEGVVVEALGRKPGLAAWPPPPGQSPPPDHLRLADHEVAVLANDADLVIEARGGQGGCAC